MRRNMIRAGVASLAAVGAVAALPGIASATDSTPEPIGGRERVKVTVVSTETTQLNCTVWAKNAGPVTFPIPKGERGSVVISQVAPGPGKVRVVCTGGAMPFDRTYPVEVDLANPAMDAIDSVFIGAGSSGLATDPTLR
ncbi:hypothetical protein J2W56_006835 [Nocardia kruczakiae]|uniref:Ig-like domain-containing protein n=1 Tax=Nocardia kruczakiae TaxID=261477 RepID=A0ABU1XR78_9NOCA|nr:hypothetical protein [Nocardia kruczakiae]MDR7173069.1 hypothetical protein [Nocardia kruczakiae]